MRNLSREEIELVSGGRWTLINNEWIWQGEEDVVVVTASYGSGDNNGYSDWGSYNDWGYNDQPPGDFSSGGGDAATNEGSLQASDGMGQAAEAMAAAIQDGIAAGTLNPNQPIKLPNGVVLPLGEFADKLGRVGELAQLGTLGIAYMSGHADAKDVFSFLVGFVTERGLEGVGASAFGALLGAQFGVASVGAEIYMMYLGVLAQRAQDVWDAGDQNRYPTSPQLELTDQWMRGLGGSPHPNFTPFP